MFERIVVGYDGSTGSKKALDKAIELKKLIPAIKLSVLYVNEDAAPDLTHNGPDPAVAGMTAAPADGAYTNYVPPAFGPLSGAGQAEQPPDFDYSKQMHNSIQQRLHEHLIEGDVLAIEGNPAHTISAYADEQKIDLLIVGNSGKSGLQKFFVGSVSEKVIQNAPCSVLVVK